MGTSASSKGPSAGVSFDPPWLDDSGDFQTTPQSTPDSLPVAPPSRFREARNNIRKYACENAGRAGFRKAAGHYSKSGMGGAAKVASRMRHSTSTGARLAEFLSQAGSKTNPAVNAWVKDIFERKLGGQALIDAIIQHIAPNGGSRDEESCADSMARAVGDFLQKNPDADLFSLNLDEVRDITERFLAHEACNRLVNDAGQIFESATITLKQSMELLNEMREYLRADISTQVRQLWKTTDNPTRAQLDHILRSSIKRTFEIYEGET